MKNLKLFYTLHYILYSHSTMQLKTKKIKFKILTYIIFTLAIISCDKEESNNYETLYGNWKISQNNYSVSLNKDFSYANIYAEPWYGSIRIGDSLIYTDSVTFARTSIPGDGFSLETPFIELSFFACECYVKYNNSQYHFYGEHILDTYNGSFSATGNLSTYSYGGPGITIELQSKKITMQKNQEYEIVDGLSSFKRHMEEITLNENLTMSTLISEEGNIYKQQGGWHIKKDSIYFNIINTQSFSFQNTDTELILLDRKKTDNIHSDINIPDSLIISIQTKTHYKKD